MAISVVVAVGAAGDPLVETLRTKARQLKVGPGDAPGVEMGPVISSAQRDRIKAAIATGVSEGASIALDGRELEFTGSAEGFFVGPTIFDKVRTEMSVYREEIFGPVLSVLRVATLDDAIALVIRIPMAMARQFLRSLVEPRASFNPKSKPEWWGSMWPFPFPWRSSHSVAGSLRCLATFTCTEERAFIFTPAEK